MAILYKDCIIGSEHKPLSRKMRKGNNVRRVICNKTGDGLN